ncbi:tetratricopeptide repeat protein [bacterium]|nr:tetratricopeptide repeat protein [bacterium]
MAKARKKFTQDSALRTQDSTRYSAFLLGFALIVLTLAVYLPAMRGLFLWDDDRHFSENPFMSGPGGLVSLWTQHSFYYPLTSTTFWIARRLWGLNPLPYHLLNVLLHAVNSLLLWRLLRRLNIPAAWLAGALFALHPTNVQSVAWMTELKNVQSGLFYLLSMHAWVRFRERPRSGYLIAAMIAFALALLSKTSTVTLPLALIAIHLWRRDQIDRTGLLAWCAMFALSAGAGLLTIVLHRGMVSGPEWAETFVERLIIAGRCFWHYLGALFWPVNLSFVYPRWTIDPAQPTQWLWALTAPALFAGLWMFRKSWSRPTLIALFYFTVSLLPVLNFLKMYYTRYTYVADHWQYLANMGGVAWISGTLMWLLERAKLKRQIVMAVLCGLLVLLGSQVWRQAGIYRDQPTLWRDVIARNPKAAISYNNLGTYFISLGDQSAAVGDKARAQKCYETAAKILGVGLAQNPGETRLLTIRGVALINSGQPQDALVALEEAGRKLPNDPEILNNTALALNLCGRKPEAIQTWRRAIGIKPDFSEAYFNLARILFEMGNRGEALETLGRGLAKLPNQPDLLRLRAEIEAATR